MIRVFLVDDHELVRRGIADIVDAERDLEVVGECGTAGQALGRVGATRPDVVVLDVRLPDGSGVDVCRAIRSEYPEIACLMLTAFDDDEASEAAVLAGASGYVLKDIRGKNLIDGIRRVAGGGSLITRSVSQRVVSRLAPAEAQGGPELTLRERQVLDLIGDRGFDRAVVFVHDLSDAPSHDLERLHRGIGDDRQVRALAGLRQVGDRGGLAHVVLNVDRAGA